MQLRTPMCFASKFVQQHRKTSIVSRAALLLVPSVDRKKTWSSLLPSFQAQATDFENAAAAGKATRKHGASRRLRATWRKEPYQSHINTCSNKKLVETSALLVVTGALLVVTRSCWKHLIDLQIPTGQQLRPPTGSKPNERETWQCWYCLSFSCYMSSFGGAAPLLKNSRPPRITVLSCSGHRVGVYLLLLSRSPPSKCLQSFDEFGRQIETQSHNTDMAPLMAIFHDIEPDFNHPNGVFNTPSPISGVCVTEACKAPRV